MSEEEMWFLDTLSGDLAEVKQKMYQEWKNAGEIGFPPQTRYEFNKIKRLFETD